MCRCRSVEVSEEEKEEVRWKVSVWRKEGDKTTSESNKQI